MFRSLSFDCVFFSHSFISFHQGQTPTALTRKASHVVLFFILSVCISSSDQVKQLSELDFKVKAAVVLWDSALQQIVHVGTFNYIHIQFVSRTYTCSPTPDRHQAIVLCPCCCAGVFLCHVISFDFFHVAICFTLVVNFKWKCWLKGKTLPFLTYIWHLPYALLLLGIISHQAPEQYAPL